MDSELCLICEAGTLVEHIDTSEGWLLAYSKCDHCKSECATLDQMRRNVEEYKKLEKLNYRIVEIYADAHGGEVRDMDASKIDEIHQDALTMTVIQFCQKYPEFVV